jgi:hypothetical protein
MALRWHLKGSEERKMHETDGRDKQLLVTNTPEQEAMTPSDEEIKQQS